MSAASAMHLSAMRLDDRDRAYCGRRVPAAARTTNLNEVTCGNCLAAARADGVKAVAPHA